MQPYQRKVLHYVVDGRDRFGEWLDSLPDALGQTVIIQRLSRVEKGNFGDHCSLGGGVWELRIHYGPGYRVYYGEDGPIIILLICGGDKRTQRRDIRKAHRLWAEHGGRK